MARGLLALLAMGVAWIWAPSLLRRLARVELNSEEGLRVRTIDFRGNRFDVTEVSLERWKISTVWLGKGRELRQVRETLLEKGRHPVVLTNAGIFDLGFVPTGLLVSDGVERHPLNSAIGEGNFFLRPTGVFQISAAGASIVETDEYRGENVIDATQSGPLLVHHNVFHPGINETSANLKLRNAVGVRDSAHVVFVISRGEVNFWTVAALLRDELRCADGLFLDGEISGLWVDGASMEADLSRGPFAGVLAVEKRP